MGWTATADPLHVVAIHELGKGGEHSVACGVEEILLDLPGWREANEQMTGWNQRRKRVQWREPPLRARRGEPEV
jgi:hypothetical protein